MQPSGLEGCVVLKGPDPPFPRRSRALLRAAAVFRVGFWDAKRAPRRASRGPQDGPRGPRDAKRALQDAQGGPKTGQESSKTAQEAPEKPSKRAPRSQNR